MYQGAHLDEKNSLKTDPVLDSLTLLDVITKQEQFNKRLSAHENEGIDGYLAEASDTTSVAEDDVDGDVNDDIIRVPVYSANLGRSEIDLLSAVLSVDSVTETKDGVLVTSM